MGISASIIRFVNEDQCNNGKFIEDYDEEMTLFEFLPEEIFGKLINKVQIEIYDLDYYKSVYDPDLYIQTIYSNADLELSNGIYIKCEDVKTKYVECNRIYYNDICYIGGASIFRKDIYEVYNNTKHFPYLWNINCLNELMGEIPDHITECISKQDDINNLFINLGY